MAAATDLSILLHVGISFPIFVCSCLTTSRVQVQPGLGRNHSGEQQSFSDSLGCQRCFKFHRLWTNGDANSLKYLLVENRQMAGSDEFLPGRGLLIWHIDDRMGSNADENHPWVKLMQADGLDQLKQNFGRGDDGDGYPGGTDNRKFSSLTNLNSKSYGGDDTFVSVTNIPISSPTMTFDITVKKGDQPPAGKFDLKTWYRLKSTYQPATHCLDIVNDNGTNSKGLLHMAVTGKFSGQYWQLKPNGDGSYFLRTLFLGPNRRLSVRSDKKTPILEAANDSAKAQYWGAWDNPQDGTWHLEVSQPMVIALHLLIIMLRMPGLRSLSTSTRWRAAQKSR